MISSDFRLKWIDCVRAVAIVCVILCHSTELVYHLDIDVIKTFSMQSQMFCFTCFTIGRLGVPFFLMITGYLLLQKEYDSAQVKVFWKTKWLHLLICTLFWFFLYDVFLIAIKHQSISAKAFISDMLFLHKINMSHVWYLPMILGMYILIPFVSSALKKYDYKLFYFPMLFYTCYSFGFPLMKAIVCCFKAETFLVNQLSTGFSGGTYGIYIICGYFISKETLKKVKTVIIATASSFCFIAIILLQVFSYSNGTGYKVWYDNLLLLITSIGLFEIASRSNNIKGYNVIKVVSIYAFPLYLTHNIVKSLIGDIICSLPISKPLQVICLWGTCFAYGMLMSVIISRIPKIGRYLLYMKVSTNNSSYS